MVQKKIANFANMTDKQLIKEIARLSGETPTAIRRLLRNDNKQREAHDFYATHPSCSADLLKVESFNKNVCDPCAGGGHLMQAFEANGYNVIASDLINRGYGIGGVDFLSEDFNSLLTVPVDFVINPPYKLLLPFIKKCLELTNNKVAVLMPLRYLSGKERSQFFKEKPPKVVYVYVNRINMAKNGDFEKYQKTTNMETYAWVVWEKGYKGATTLKWLINII